MNRYFLLVIVFFGLVYSCSDSELITPGDEFVIPLEPGTFIADLNDETFDFSAVVSANSDEVATSINGVSKGGESISLTFQSPIIEGNFNQLEGATITIETQTGIYINIGETGELLPLSIKVTEVDMAAKTVTGTFTATVYSLVLDEKLEVTNGKFHEIPFTLSEESNSTLKALFDGAPLDFNTDAAAINDASLSTISGVSNTMENLIISVPQELEIGTFTDVEGVIIQLKIGTSTDPNDVYTNYDAASSTTLPVSIVITELTEGTDARIKGRFIGKIKKFVGGTGEEIDITDGEFDVPVN